MLVAQLHRGIRVDDIAGGKMGGAGRHLTTRGTFEAYKLEKVKGNNKKRKREQLQQGADTMASKLASCGPAFSFFKGVCTAHCSLLHCHWCMDHSLSCSTGTTPL